MPRGEFGPPGSDENVPVRHCEEITVRRSTKQSRQLTEIASLLSMLSVLFVRHSYGFGSESKGATLKR
jgi:hypothetical protein